MLWERGRLLVLSDLFTRRNLVTPHLEADARANFAQASASRLLVNDLHIEQACLENLPELDSDWEEHFHTARRRNVS